MPIFVCIIVDDAINTLPFQMYKEKGFQPSVQRWIVEKRLAEDGNSLSSCGVSSDGHTLYLYIMSRKSKTVHPALEGMHLRDTFFILNFLKYCNYVIAI